MRIRIVVAKPISYVNYSFQHLFVTKLLSFKTCLYH